VGEKIEVVCRSAEGSYRGLAKAAAMYGGTWFVEAGGLASYSADFDAMIRRVAYYIERILKGAQPATLPIEQPTKFDLIFNLKTAKALGLTVPEALLVRADRLIEE
jgi:putative ABC transport system substrate-binding protein